MDLLQRFEKFGASRQAAVKLELALEDGFREDLPEECRRTYEAYLRSRMVPAVQALIEREDTETLRVIRERGWFPLTELDRLIDFAARQEKIAASVWLLRLKQETVGFEKPDFSL